MADFARASVEDLRKFGDSVKNFEVKIDAALRQLEMDTATLRNNVDERSIVPMQYAVKYINEIIKDASPALKSLASQAELYAEKLAQIEARIAAGS
jgi:hypothetical protein